jgi:hypothetical protein
MAAQLSLRADAEQLKESARVYEAEADRIDAASEQLKSET